MKLGSDNLSNNEVASGNFSPTVNLDGVLKGGEKLIAMLFPDIRFAIMEKLNAEALFLKAKAELCQTDTVRHQVETFLKIGMSARQILEVLNIQFNPIPPKAALPLFEKSSLEHEEEMYSEWAKLLVATADEYNPIHMQYAEILSKIGSDEANILKTIYETQAQNSNGKECLLLFERFYAQITSVSYQSGQKLVVTGASKEPEYKVTYPNSNSPLFTIYSVTENELPKDTSIMLLEQLGLLKKFPLPVNDKFQIVLSPFGYTFIETLEKYNLPKEDIT